MPFSNGHVHVVLLYPTGASLRRQIMSLLQFHWNVFGDQTLHQCWSRLHRVRSIFSNTTQQRQQPSLHTLNRRCKIIAPGSNRVQYTGPLEYGALHRSSPLEHDFLHWCAPTCPLENDISEEIRRTSSFCWWNFLFEFVLKLYESFVKHGLYF